MSLKRLRVVAGFCGIVAPLLIWSFIFLAIHFSPWFDWSRNALSDLGVDGRAAFLFNYGLIIGGILLFPFTMGLRQVLPRGRLSLLGTTLLSLDVLVLSGIGWFPEYEYPTHLYLSIVFFTLLPLSFTLIGASELRHPGRKEDRILTFSVGLSAALVWIFPWGGAAIPEALSGLLGSTWAIFKASRLIREPQTLV